MKPLQFTQPRHYKKPDGQLYLIEIFTRRENPHLPNDPCLRACRIHHEHPRAEEIAWLVHAAPKMQATLIEVQNTLSDLMDGMDQDEADWRTMDDLWDKVTDALREAEPKPESLIDVKPALPVPTPDLLGQLKHNLHLLTHLADCDLLEGGHTMDDVEAAITETRGLIRSIEPDWNP